VVQQKFLITDQGGGLVEVRNSTTNKCLDLDAGSTADGAKLQEWDCLGGPNQRFFLVPQGAGYALKPSQTGKCMDVDGATGKFQQWSCIAGNQNQTFALVREDGVANAGWSGNANYRMKPIFSGKCVDLDVCSTNNDARYHQYPCASPSPQQIFNLTDLGGGLFQIKNATTNKCMDLDSGNAADGAIIHQWDCLGGPNQKFYLVPQGNGFAIKPYMTNKCLDVDGGTNLVQQWSCYGNPNQTFSLTRE
jgi:hypothetical protein